MYMYLCIHTNVYVYMCICIYIYMYSQSHWQRCVCIFESERASVRVSLCVWRETAWVSECGYVFVFVCVCTDVCKNGVQTHVIWRYRFVNMCVKTYLMSIRHVCLLAVVLRFFLPVHAHALPLKGLFLSPSLPSPLTLSLCLSTPPLLSFPRSLSLALSFSHTYTQAPTILQ